MGTKLNDLLHDNLMELHTNYQTSHEWYEELHCERSVLAHNNSHLTAVDALAKMNDSYEEDLTTSIDIFKDCYKIVAAKKAEEEAENEALEPE